jgi:hypothetical protein
MSQPRAADDFKAIRARMEELRRQRLPEQPARVSDTNPGANPRADIIGHRGPCSCGLSLFADECDGCCKAL